MCAHLFFLIFFCVFCYRKRNTVDILDRDKECVRIDTAHRERLIAALLTPQTFKNKWSGLPGMSVGYVCFLFFFYCYCFFFVSLERVERNECGVCLFFTKNKFLTKQKYLFIARFCRTSGLGCQAYMWGIFIFLFFYCFFFRFFRTSGLGCQAYMWGMLFFSFFFLTRGPG